MFTIGSGLGGISISPSNDNLFARHISPPPPRIFAHHLSSYPTKVTKVARHSPDSSVSGEIEVSENEISEKPTEMQIEVSEKEITEKPTDQETPSRDSSDVTAIRSSKKD